MTQEEKQLLLKDLCGRVYYGVICADSRHGDSRITEINIVDETVYCDDFDEYVELDKIKSYLRPMSSMTEEEIKEYEHLIAFSGSSYGAANLVDWLNKKMFAYRNIDDKNMFELGLALKAPDGMYK